MVKTFRKVIGLFTAVTLVASLVGCGGNKSMNDNITGSVSKSTASTTNAAQATTADEKKPITLKWFTILPQKYIPAGGIMNSPVYQEITKRTGVTIDFSVNAGVADSKEKIGVLLASGELPDMITTDDYSINANILKSKSAIELDDLVKNYGPDIQKNCGTALNVSKVMRSDETGKLYFLAMDVVNGSNLNTLNPTNAFGIRWDLYKKLGYTKPVIDSEEELLKIVGDMLKLEPKNKDGKANYGIGNPLGDAAGFGRLMFPFIGTTGMYCATYEAFVDVGTNKMYSSLDMNTSPILHGLSFYNKAYRMGLFDPECLVMKSANFYEKAGTGRYMAMSYLWVKRSNVNQKFIEQRTPEKGYVPILVNPRKDALYMSDNLQTGDFPSTCITTACKDPQRVVEFINYLCTAEGASLQKYGIEGKDWFVKDGYGTYSDEVANGFKNDPEYAVKTGLNVNGDYNYITFLDPKGLKIDGVYGDFSMSPAVINSTMNEVQKDFCTVNNLKYPAEYLEKAAPATSFDSWACATINLPAGSDFEAKDAKIIPYLNDSLVKLVVSKTEDDLNAGINKVIADAKKLGFDDVFNYSNKTFEDLKVNYDKINKK